MAIWQAFGPNLSDDSRTQDPDFGIFEGEREDVIDWVDAHNPGFRDHLEGRKFPKARLARLSAKTINREMVNEYNDAVAAKRAADAKLAKLER